MQSVEVVDLIEELDRVLKHLHQMQPDLYQVLEGKHAYTNYRVAERLKGLILELETRLEE